MAGAATAVVPASTMPDFRMSRRFMVVLPFAPRVLQGPRQFSGDIVAQFRARARPLCPFSPRSAAKSSVCRQPKAQRLGADQAHEIAFAAPICHTVECLDQ